MILYFMEGSFVLGSDCQLQHKRNISEVN